MADKITPADEVNAAEQEKVEAAVTPGDTSERRPGIGDAQKAELKRQADIEKAVAQANKSELPKLGGDLLEPGLGR